MQLDPLLSYAMPFAGVNIATMVMAVLQALATGREATSDCGASIMPASDMKESVVEQANW